MQEIFLSIDVEATGPVPGLNSMIELGVCVVGDPENSFSACLLEDSNSGWNRQTREWWFSTDQLRRTLSEIQEQARPIGDVMFDFKDWVSQFRRPIITAFPTSFDFPFLKYYWNKWITTNNPPFSHGAMDIKSYAAGVLGVPYWKTTKKELKKKFPSGFRADLRHTHRALDDAREQAYLIEQLMKVRGMMANG